ncbi:Oxygen regulatory protein NreC [Enhygromyxa salina]|uniref:Oxygen regulatory protein NreC n=1 Tax=Enhygromyxa salina TaxID=215803 RepID=A0A2S9YEY2_9BACT|nr:LuxR C-terminal-related transcriptional regulator [Enhygromyxa salina]PRQ03678.1 Oxygen regulatory protein NreC [Enhygromyxa salina]
MAKPVSPREPDEIDGDLVPCIEVTEGRSRGKVFPLERPRGYVVGRLPGAEITIDDPGVSRRHIRITRRADGSIDAADMRSTNGLIINEEKVERGPLRAGDLIALGPDAVLRLVYRPPGQLGPSVSPSEATIPPDVIAPEVQAPEDSTAIIIRRPKLEDIPLSARQLEVSQLVANGMTNAAIAEQLGISPRTVTSHLDHIYGRLEIGSRAALTRWIVERGLVAPGQ